MKIQPLFSIRLSLSLATAIAALFAASAASAQTWDGSDSNAWQTAANWSSTPPFSSSTILTFHAVGATNLITALGGSNRIVNSLVFNANVTSAVGISLSSATATSARVLTFAGTNPAITVNSAASGDITIGNGAGPGTSFGNVALSANLGIAHNGSGTLAINRLIQGVGFAVTKTGGGTLALSANNTFSGNLTLNGGTIRASSSTGALGAGGLILTSGSLVLNHSANLAFNRNTTVNGNVDIQSSRNVAGAGLSYTLGTLAIGANKLTVGAGLTDSGTASLTFGATTLSDNAEFEVVNGTGSATNLNLGAVGETGGARNLTKSGSGSLTLSGTNTYTGTTNINGGTLALSGTGDINPSSDITINGSVAKLLQNSSVAGTTGITLTLGTLTGNGTVGAVDVADSVDAVLSNNNGVAGAALSTGNLTFNGAATVNTFSNSASAAIVAAGISTNAAGTVTINPSGIWTSGATHNLMSYTGGSIGGAGFGQFALGTVSGLNARQSAGPLVDSGTAITFTVSGDTPVWSGVGSSTWTTATTGNNSGPNDWALKTANTGTNFWAEDGVEFNDTYNLGGGPVAVANTTVTITGGVAPTTTLFNNSAINYTLTTSDATGITSGGLTKSGSGTLTINNANTYTGGTILNAGAVEVGNADALGTSGVISFGGGTLKYGSGITTDLSSRLSTDASQAYRIDTNGNDVIFGTALTSVGGTLTKSGAGILSLTANNTASIGTTVSGGTLLAAKNAAALNALGSGVVDIASGSTLQLDILKTTNATDTIANTFTGSGLLKLQFAAGATGRNVGLTDVTGFNGTIQLSNLGTTGDKWSAASVGTVAGSLVIDSGSTIYVTGDVSFTGGITVNGAGNSENRGALRLAGATTVLGGNISLASSSTIGMENTAAQITGDITSSVAGAHTLTLGAPSNSTPGGTLSGNISDGNGTIAITQSGGFYTLSGTNTYTGATTINGGTLKLDAGGSIANSPSITLASGTTFDVSSLTTALALGSGQTLASGGTGANPTATVTTLSGKDLTLSAGGLAFSAYGGANGNSATNAPLTVSGASSGELKLNGAPVTVTTTTSLASGDYVLVGAAGSATVTGTPGALTVNGSGASGTTSLAVTDGQLVLTVASGSPYSSWATGKGLTGLPGSSTDPAKDADPDKDGKNNLQEFAFNGDPLDPSDNGMIAGFIQDTDTPADTNELTLIVAVRNGASFGANGSPVVQTATVDSVVYTIEGTLDLTTIPGSAVSHASGPSNTAPAESGLTEDLSSSDWKYHTFTLDASEGLPNKGFLRAKVSE